LSLNGISNFQFGQNNENENGFSVPEYVKELNNYTSEESKKVRKIPKAPYKVLDAPALQDDFYLNLIDWSNSNILAVGLGSAVYLWAPETGKVTKLCDLSRHWFGSRKPTI
jgi:cell division cycle 20-like protein 1 (cofactor of APC complex)